MHNARIFLIIILETIKGYFACPMTATGNLINKVYKLHRLSPIAVEDSHLTSYGGCRYMSWLQIQPVKALKSLTYSYVPSFPFPEKQPPDYPYIVLIWLIILYHTDTYPATIFYLRTNLWHKNKENRLPKPFLFIFIIV